MDTSPENSLPRVVIGAGPAGVSAALAMRETGFGGDILLIDAEPHLPYEKPPLSKTLLVPGAVPPPIVPAERYAEAGITLLLGVTVTRLDRARRVVVCADGRELPAGKVVLATGAAPRPLPVPGAELENVLTLRSAADARRLSESLATGGPLLVVGAGFIGLELAALARDGGIPVTVVERAPYPLGHLGDAAAEVTALVRRRHEERGVAFRFGAQVAALRGEGAVAEAVLADGSVLPATTVVVGVGVVPRHSLAREAGIAVDGAGIVVDPHGITSDPWVLAAGDVTSQPHPSLAVRGRIEHWNVALGHGAAVGGTAVGEPVAYAEVPYAWSDQYGSTYQSLGRAGAGDTLVLREGASPERFLACWLREGRLTAVMGLGVPREVGALRRLFASTVPLDPELLADPATDLRRLPRAAAR